MVELSISVFANVYAFAILTIAPYTIFYFIGKANPKKGISVSILVFSLGLNLIGLSHLIDIWVIDIGTRLVSFILMFGGTFTLIGIVGMFYDKMIEISTLKKREEDLNKMIDSLKQRYYQREISEEDLKTAYNNMLRELTEIQIKIRKEK